MNKIINESEQQTVRRKCLFVANTIKLHIKLFHLPYLKWFQEQGWEVHVAAREDADIPYCDKIYNISIQGSPFKWKNISAYRQLKAIMEQEKYDIIHGHTPMGGVLARLCGKKFRKSGTKMIYTAHGFYYYKGAPLINWLLYYPVEKWLSKHTDALTTMNQEDYQIAALKMKAKNLYYVPGVGLDTDKFSKPIIDRNTKRNELGIPLDANVIISVGELRKRKNHQVAIRAISRMKSDNLYYVICGQGDLKNYLEKMCIKLKVENRVIFLGFRTDTVDLLHMSDIFLFPSLQEGLPVALMEAMAAGLPCVVSRIRGNIDLIEHDKGGFPCKVNKIDEYIDAVKKFLENDDLRYKMGEYNKKAVNKFNLSNVMNEMLKIYELYTQDNTLLLVRE